MKTHELRIVVSLNPDYRTAQVVIENELQATTQTLNADNLLTRIQTDVLNALRYPCALVEKERLNGLKPATATTNR